MSFTVHPYFRNVCPAWYGPWQVEENRANAAISSRRDFDDPAPRVDPETSDHLLDRLVDCLVVEMARVGIITS